MSGVATFLMAWRGTLLRFFSRAAGTAEMRLLSMPTRAPETEIERLMVDTLATKGSLSPRVLVSLAACALYRWELSHGGGLADLGLFGETLFVRDVTRAIETARGVLWEIEPSSCCRSRLSRHPEPETRTQD